MMKREIFPRDQIVPRARSSAFEKSTNDKVLRTVTFAVVLAVTLPFAAGGQAASGFLDPLNVVQAFYHANDMGQFEAALKFVAEDIKFDTWATGANGYMMAQRHLTGRKALLAFLPNARGVRHRLPDHPLDGPVYHETQLSISGNKVTFRLEPDRKAPDGRPYTPFSVEAIVNGCQIKTLTVIERVTQL